MVTERTTKELFIEHCKKVILDENKLGQYARNSADIPISEACDSMERDERAWVLKEDYEELHKMISQHDCYGIIRLKNILDNSPPDDSSVLKKDSEEQATEQKPLEKPKVSFGCGQAKNSDASEEDTYTQEEIIHCPKTECKGMLLTSPYKHEMRCSGCYKYFMLNTNFEEVSR